MWFYPYFQLCSQAILFFSLISQSAPSELNRIIKVDRTRRAVHPDKSFRWNTATIPYDFDSRRSTPEFKAAVEDALEAFHVFTCLKFVPRSAERDYIEYTLGRSCSSLTGRWGGMQIISLSRACADVPGTIIHETMHALGFYHEHNRPDRDQFITVNESAIVSNRKWDFEISPEAQTLDTPYDFNSIMHYNLTDWSSDGVSKTLIPKVPYEGEAGQRESFSEMDVRRIRTLFNCTDDSVISSWSEWSNWTSCNPVTCNITRKRKCWALYGHNCSSSQPDVENSACQKICPWFEWTPWTSWSSCDSTCRSRRERMCHNEDGSESDLCQGPGFDLKFCENCGWTSWTSWSECSARCGWGQSVRVRRCQRHGCGEGIRDGHNQTLTYPCLVRRMLECPLSERPKGSWSQWGKWSRCSATCGSYAERSRYRYCRPLGAQCDAGETSQCEACSDLPHCPNGVWSVWTQWSTCMDNCHPPDGMRSRECLHADDCPGVSLETRSCGCFIWSDWQPWSLCSRTCGVGGTRTRKRTCKGGGCAGSPSATVNCYDMPDCPIPSTVAPSENSTATEDPNCKDSYVICATWAANNQCNGLKKDFMHLNCRKSCGLC